MKITHNQVDICFTFLKPKHIIHSNIHRDFHKKLQIAIRKFHLNHIFNCCFSILISPENLGKGKGKQFKYLC